MARPGGKDESWEYSLRKYLLLLATLVATVTYGAGFNPPGGVWQTADRAAHRIAGDPIIRDTNYARYLAFFYSNATAFASSLVVIVLVLILSVLHDSGGIIRLAPLLGVLRAVMVLDLLSLMGAYAAGAFRDTLTAVYSLVLSAGVVGYLVAHLVLASRSPAEEDKYKRGKSAPERLRKVLMLLATFAASVTYVAGLSAPGGFWDHPEDGHRPGDAILKGGPHDARLKAFFVCNTTAFVASLLILVMLLEKKLCFSQKVRSYEIYGFIAVTLISLLAAYAAGSSRKIDTTIYVSALVGVVAVCILIQVVFVLLFQQANSSQGQQTNGNGSDERQQTQGPETSNDNNGSDEHEKQQNQALEKARSLVLLLATLATAITYQAGLNPPGGLWQSDGGSIYKIGDPILLTTNPRRYKAFYYCNSVAFVASLVAIVLVRKKTLHHHNALEAAMVLDLFGLIGAYAAGSCRDVSTSIYAMALAGVVLVYVVIHVVLLTLDHKDGSASARGNDETSLEEKNDAELVEKRRKRLLLFAILAATITYQAGLTPPGGFLVQDDSHTGRHAGDPVLLNNYPRRYTAFFYCNSVSFMLSIALIILLVNPNLYHPAIRSNALSVCTAAGLIGIMGGYAAGCTQHLKTSIYIFALAAVVLSTVVLLAAVFLVIHLKKQDDNANCNRRAAREAPGEEEEEASAVAAEVPNAMGAEHRAPQGAKARREGKRAHAKRKYLMLLGILVASVTYQAGLAPPGGAWQSNDGTHTAGDPVMHDYRRARYLAFFYSNSTSFVASVIVIVLLLPEPLHEHDKWWWLWLGVMNATIVLDLLGLLIAYAAGSSRTWKTSVYVSALVLAVLAYFAIHVLLSSWVRRGKKTAPDSASQENGERNEAAT
ncbi:unnamed protein product [Miscanthus lutarioriparius]|uniref:PGG domain-containing protein n=1 Tax=Miscanthus lutarioriparius TaxID=422564 RepID=A0A811MS92_9POAL|nr:unnamed protein product [Miscanthus lutarioriparius]